MHPITHTKNAPQHSVLILKTIPISPSLVALSTCLKTYTYRARESRVELALPAPPQQRESKDGAPPQQERLERKAVGRLRCVGRGGDEASSLDGGRSGAAAGGGQQRTFVVQSVAI